MRSLRDETDSEVTAVRTRQDEEDKPVHDQNGPEDGNVEEVEECAEEGDCNSPGGPVPELELGEATNEGLKLFILLRWKGSD